MKEYKKYFFPWQHSTATPVHLFIIGVTTRWELNKFEKIRIFSEQLCTLWLTFLCFWFITNIDIGYIHHYNIYTARSFSFQTTWRHRNKAVQQAVPLISTHINVKALTMIKWIKMQFKKGFKNVNISTGLFFFKKRSLITAISAQLSYMFNSTFQGWTMRFLHDVRISCKHKHRSLF